MSFFEYLYFKYYCFQVKVGNSDIAPFSSMLIIVFSLMLYYSSIFFFSLLFIPNGTLSDELIRYVLFALLGFTTICLYYFIARKGKYQEVLKRTEKYRGKKNLAAILFPLVGFLLFVFSMFLKMYQNRGTF